MFLFFITTDSIKSQKLSTDFSLRICLANSIAFVLYMGLVTKSFTFSFNSRSETLLILMPFGPIPNC